MFSDPIGIKVNPLPWPSDHVENSPAYFSPANPSLHYAPVLGFFLLFKPQINLA
jgi:hypothetical protein